MVFLRRGVTGKPLIFVGMSGGVDSSVAAALLKQDGNDVVGVHLRCYNVDGCAEQDAEDARRAAETIGIPFYVMDFEREYKAAVVNYMVDGYRRGLTPNPDVMCNREIKFGLFLKKALVMGADYIATGHYARRREIKNQKAKIKNYALATARDLNKDQTYFLWTLTQEQLRYCLFPIGEYTKPQVRAMARRFGLPNAEKKDSQGICFLGKVTLTDFLGRYIPAHRGLVVNTEGTTVGNHRGVQFYTIGQRHIGVANRGFTRTERGTTRTGNMKPFYVVKKDACTNTLTVAEGDDHPALYRKEVRLTDVHFINPQHPYKLENVRMLVYARVRYRQPFAKAALTIADWAQTNAEKSLCKSAHSPRGSVLLVFEQGQKFVAPGQSAVFYSRRGELLGGGIIS